MPRTSEGARQVFAGRGLEEVEKPSPHVRTVARNLDDAAHGISAHHAAPAVHMAESSSDGAQRQHAAGLKLNEAARPLTRSSIQPRERCGELQRLDARDAM